MAHWVWMRNGALDGHQPVDATSEAGGDRRAQWEDG